MKTIVVFAGNECKDDKKKHYFQLAYDLGLGLGKAGYTVATGAGHGLMDEATRGACEAGGDTIGIGFNIEGRRQSQFVKSYECFDDLSERQQKLISLGDAFVALPGGVGTMYEIFEILAMRRIFTLSAAKPLILLGEYYEPYKTIFKNLVFEGFVDEKTMSNVWVVSTPAEVIEKLS